MKNHEKIDICPVYLSKHNSNCVKIILLDSKRGRMALWCSKKWSVLLRGITSKRYDDFCCLTSFFLRRKNKFKSHKKVCENKDFCKH